MKKRNKSIVLFEIALLILSSFAIAFILSENLTNAQSVAPAATGTSSTITAQTIGAGTKIVPGTTVYSGAVQLPGDFGIVTAVPGSPITTAPLETGGFSVTQGTNIWNIPAGDMTSSGSVITSIPPSVAGIDTHASILGYKLPAVGWSAGSTFFFAHLIEGLVWGGVLAL